MRRIRPQVNVNVLQFGGSSDTTGWVGDEGPFRSDGEEGGRYVHWVPYTYHGEEIVTVRRRNVVDAWGGRSAEGCRNAVGDDLYRDNTVNHGIDGGVIPTI